MVKILRILEKQYVNIYTHTFFGSIKNRIAYLLGFKFHKI